MVKSYNRANGLIFLSDYTREIISPYIQSKVTSTVIPHGVNEYFRRKEHEIKDSDHSSNETIHLLYVSKVFTYKNHDKVILAVDLLRKKLKLDIHLTLVGWSIPGQLITY